MVEADLVFIGLGLYVVHHFLCTVKRGIELSGVFIKDNRPALGYGVLYRHVFFHTGDGFFLKPFLDPELFDQHFFLFWKQLTAFHLFVMHLGFVHRVHYFQPDAITM